MTFLKSDLSNTLKTLKEIDTDDEYIKERVIELRKKVKKMKTPSPNNLLFMSKKRSKKYYAWWDEETEEAIIYQYAKIE